MGIDLVVRATRQPSWLPRQATKRSTRQLILQGTLIGSEQELHETLARELDLGCYYGRDMAALWDRLTTDLPRPLDLVWKDWRVSRAQLGREGFKSVCRVLRDVEERDASANLPDRFTFRLD